MIKDNSATLRAFLAHAIADFQGIDDIRKEIFRNPVKPIEDYVNSLTEHARLQSCNQCNTTKVRQLGGKETKPTGKNQKLAWNIPHFPRNCKNVWKKLPTHVLTSPCSHDPQNSTCCCRLPVKLPTLDDWVGNLGHACREAVKKTLHLTSQFITTVETETCELMRCPLPL